MSIEKISEKPLILLIDDSQKILTSFKSFFEEDHGFEVQVASTSEQAVQLVQNITRPAVVILDRFFCNNRGDVVLGEDLLLELRVTARFQIITIVYSGDATVSAELKAIRAGAFSYFPKGGDEELFIARVWQARDFARQLIEPNEDPLTKALNRRAMFDRVTRELSRAQRSRSVTTCLMYDIDKLGPINNKYGHPVGDKVIVSIVDSLRVHIRKTDVICRYGGDEILVFLFDVEYGWVERFIKKSNDTIREKKIGIEGGSPLEGFVRVGASVGSAVLTPQMIAEEVEKQGGNQDIAFTLLIEALIKEADMDMYKNKNEGRCA